MKAGKLQHLVTIQDYAVTRDATGGEVKAWATHAQRWAWMKPLTGSEKYVNQQLIAQVSHEINIRYASGVRPKMRVLYGTRTFDIVAVLDWEEKGTELKLLCKELI